LHTPSAHATTVAGYSHVPATQMPASYAVNWVPWHCSAGGFEQSIGVETQLPPLQMSSMVHGSPSLHCAPSLGAQ
jgi:hypothetical protein